MNSYQSRISLKDFVTRRIVTSLKTLLAVFNRRPPLSPTSLKPLTQKETPWSPALQQLSREATSPRTACALLSTLVLHFDGPARTRQLERIAWYGDEALMAEILRLEPRVVVLSPDERLSLVPAAISGLALLPSHRRHRFMANLRSLINADDTVSLFEYTCLLLVETGLETSGPDPKPAPVNPEEVTDQIATLIAILARAMFSDEAAARRAYDTAMRSLSISYRTFPACRASFERLSGAMRGLRRASPLLAERILNACEVVIAHTTTANTPPSEEGISLLRALRRCFPLDVAMGSADQETEPNSLSRPQ